MSGEGWGKREREKRRGMKKKGEARGWERCIVETHITGKTLRVTWRTVGNGPSSPKASFTWGGRRISPTLMPPRSSTKNPLFRFLSLSLSLSSLGRIRKESQLPSCKTATPRNKTRDIIIIGEVDPVAVNLSEEEGSLRYCCSSRKWILVSDLRIVRGRKIYNGREENISCSRLF